MMPPSHSSSIATKRPIPPPSLPVLLDGLWPASRATARVQCRFPVPSLSTPSPPRPCPSRCPVDRSLLSSPLGPRSEIGTRASPLGRRRDRAMSQPQRRTGLGSRVALFPRAPSGKCLAPIHRATAGGSDRLCLGPKPRPQRALLLVPPHADPDRERTGARASVLNPPKGSAAGPPLSTTTLDMSR